MIYDLFNPAPSATQLTTPVIPQVRSPDIPGLQYVPGFLSQDEALTCLLEIDRTPWLPDLRRRVQHYGWKYDYRARRVVGDMQIGELPRWAGVLAQRLFMEGHFVEVPDQLIVNEYLPGQGIAHHVDCEPCFGETIVSVSLGSSCIMELIHLRSKAKAELLLEPGSLLMLTGTARHEWSHGIPPRRTDEWCNVRLSRERRVSMTFRNVVLTNEKR